MKVEDMVELPPPTEAELAREKQRKEQWAFYCMLGDLLKTHKGQYVAVRDGRVVASGPDREAVLRAAYDACGYVPLYVAQVSDEPPPVYRMPSFRAFRPSGGA